MIMMDSCILDDDNNSFMRKYLNKNFTRVGSQSHQVEAFLVFMTDSIHDFVDSESHQPILFFTPLQYLLSETLFGDTLLRLRD